jgi:hypothetical protein
MTELYGLQWKYDWRKEIVEAMEEFGGIKRATIRSYSAQLLSFCELVSQPNNKRNPFIVLPDYPYEKGKPIKETEDGCPIRSLLDMELVDIEDLAEEHVRRFDGGVAVDISKRLPEYEVGSPPLTKPEDPDESPHYQGGKIWFTGNPKGYRVAPKSLNVQVSALKHWLNMNWRTSKAQLKSKKLFRDLKFNRGDRLTSGLRESSLSTEQVRTMFSMANGDDGIIIGFYALMAMRPSLIPALKVRDLYPGNYEIDDGKIKILKNPPLMIVPHIDKDTGKHLEGNKASFEYPVFIPTPIAERMEVWLNTTFEEVTESTQLTPADNKRDVDYVMKKYFRKVGFTGRPYMARKFASGRVLKQLELGKKGDTLLKETMCGHKKGVQQIYDILSGIDEETETEWRTLYEQTVNKWIAENIFNIRTSIEIKIAEHAAQMAIALGVDERAAKEQLRKMMETNMSLPQFHNVMTRLIKREQERNLEARLDRLLSKKYPKGLPGAIDESVPEPDHFDEVGDIA